MEHLKTYGPDDDPNPELYLTDTYAYVDAYGSGSIPNVDHYGIRSDEDTTLKLHDNTDIDGHGRPYVKTVYTQGQAPNNAVTTYAYRNDGTLQSISVPDPSQNNAATVSYTYNFDSLGRATSMYRPDGSVGNQSGATISYDGLQTTASEVLGASGGVLATTVSQKDPLWACHQPFRSWPCSELCHYGVHLRP